ncbi:MAG: GNAT family N-acetyltransferase [Sulfurimonas sp.]|nr:GNAT family N-acetyltransferase [Sulfurimonas sp.]
MINNKEFIKENYSDQINALNEFIKDVFPCLPNRDNSLIRFGGGTALAIYYFQHRLSFDIDLFVTDAQVLNYVSPKHWIEDAVAFNGDSYIDLSNHIRVLSRKNNIKIDILVSQDNLGNTMVDDSNDIFLSTVHVESIEDIIAKKIIYRRNDNLTRDIIDIAISIKFADNILKRLYQSKAITLNDVKELYASLDRLDIETFNAELKIVNPFTKYLKIAKNAPNILKKECIKIINSTILHGKRVFLRELNIEDANGNYPNWLNDAEVCRYNSHGNITYTKEMAIEYIKSVQNSPTCKVFAIYLNDHDKHIGNISLQQISQDDKSAEFAILMGEKEFWGQGYAQESGEILMDYGFKELGLHKIYCGTSELNIPMQKLALKLNMKLINIQKQIFLKNRKLYDILEYEVKEGDRY